MYYLLLFHCNNRQVNTPRSYVIGILPVLYMFMSSYISFYLLSLSLLHIPIHYFICVLTGNINHTEIRFPILPDSLTVVFSAALRSL